MTKSKRTTTDDGDAAEVKPLTLSKADIAAFSKAAERRTGRNAYDDWRIIGRVFKKASDLACKESGQESRHSPLAKRAFSRIIADLPPISDSEGSAKQYRAALLNIEDHEPEFSQWYGKTQPRATNPIDLWQAFDRKDKKSAAPKERTFTNGQEAEARAQEEAAAKIGELTDENNDLRARLSKYESDAAPSETPQVSPEDRIDNLIEQAWRAEVTNWERIGVPNQSPLNIFTALLERLALTAFDRGVIGDGAKDIDDLVAAAHDTLHGSNLQFTGAGIDEDKDDAA
jgi:hypothetical protein